MFVLGADNGHTYSDGVDGECGSVESESEDVQGNVTSPTSPSTKSSPALTSTVSPSSPTSTASPPPTSAEPKVAKERPILKRGRLADMGLTFDYYNLTYD